MAIRWKIPFKTLRAGTLLTVNVYDSTYTGSAVVLKGAAQPFETQEENSDDVFLNVRKQSGYLRIVDDGFAADGVTAFNWRDFIPTTDVDRPVTLTDTNDNVLWQGFLQAQNFGAALFGNPQNREFPVQCSLSVTKGINIPTNQYSLHNFAYLIYKLIDSIPTPCKPQTVVIQGDAVNWLTKRVDWMNFVEKDDNGVTTAKYKLYDVLEEMCKFWGWTARTNARTLYLVSPDDNTSQLVTIPYTDIVTLASNIAINPPQESDYTSVTIDGGFSGSDDKDYQMRGISKATFDPDTNTADTNVIETFDHQLDVDMDAEGLDPQPYYTEDGHYMKTYDILTIDRLGFTAEATSGYASFNRIMRGKSADEGYGYDEPFDVIMFKKSYDGTTFATMQTKYMHSFCDGFFRMVGDTYNGADKFQEGDFFAGNKYMWMRFGVGTSRANAKWWNGKQWGDTSTTFRATIGNQTPEIFSRYQTGSGFDIQIETVSIINTGTMYGYLFVDFLGSDNFDEYSGERAFNIKDFRIEFRKNNTVVKQQFPNSGWYKLTDKELKTVTYKSENNNAIEEDASIDSIFASEKVMNPGYGIVLNINGSYLTTVAYGAANRHPEQHYIDRITNYWSTSKRKIEANLLTHDGTSSTVANGVTPGHMVMIDGTKLYPIAISHKWRDDEVGMKCMEMVIPSEVSITTDFDNVTSNAPATAITGEPLAIVLSGVDGNKVQENSVVVLMGGTDITASAYDHATKTIAIDSVTGNISITAVGKPYDAEVEYIQTDGVAYINTGVKLANTTKFSLDLYVTTPDIYVQLFGGRQSASANKLYASNDSRVSGGTNTGTWNYGNKQANFTKLSAGRHTFSNTATASTLKIDSTNTAISGATFSSTSIDFFIFTINTGSGSGALSNIAEGSRIYSGKMYTGSTLVRDFIPVRNNGIGYLYDKVSGNFYGNDNYTGAFVIGPDKQ